MMRSKYRFALGASILAAAIFAAAKPVPQAQSQPAGPLVIVDQGGSWSRAQAREFYATDQGSRIMPIAWMRALALPDGGGFLDDGLARYNYLPNPDSGDGLPVGFTVATYKGERSLGMTCAACHTRQIEVSGTQYRIDGGPAMADFQSFLADLNAAAGAVLASDEAFNAFAARLSGLTGEEGDGVDEGAAPESLRADFEAWHHRFDAIVSGSLPDPAWGPGRLDAISMIFNRVSGLDIGEGPDRLITENIAPADAPTRYPFLWNAARQDKTQWPGFAKNGNAILGLARNLGQVYGVFGDFHPTPSDSWFGLNRNYLEINSADFSGLDRLEELVREIGAPKWPWTIDENLAAEGQAIFNLPAGEGGCVECHGIRRGAFRPPNWTWATPVQDVGTDTRECGLLTRTVKTGVMEGAKIPFFGDRLGATAPAIDVLSASVLGAIIQQKVPFGTEQPSFAASATADQLPEELQTLRDAFGVEPGAPTFGAAADAGCAYEARVLQGIWAAAPYLHNGSVPTLEDLLKPAGERTKTFKLGPNYDITTVGLATEQTVFDFALQTTGCDNLNSGRSNCGHEYGTGLSDGERKALLEYLKTL